MQKEKNIRKRNTRDKKISIRTVCTTVKSSTAQYVIQMIKILRDGYINTNQLLYGKRKLDKTTELYKTG